MSPAILDTIMHACHVFVHVNHKTEAAARRLSCMHDSHEKKNSCVLTVKQNTSMQQNVR